MTDNDETARAAAPDTKPDATPVAKKTATKKTRKKKPALDGSNLTRLAAQISSYPAGPDSSLIELLEKREGLKLRETSGGRIYAKMAGLEAGARGDVAAALTNWANAARRIARRAG